MNSITAAFNPTTGEAPKQQISIPPLKLSDGNEIPMLGYGLGTIYFKKNASSGFDEATVSHAVAAINAGYTHLDGAEAYANEAELGAAIARSLLPRSSFFITTKTSVSPKDPSISAALDRSLAALGLDYVDLYLLHHPFFADSDPSLLQTKWAEMEALRDSGRVRSIGVSNFLREHLEPILAVARHPPVINQIEYHPYLQHDESREGGDDLVRWCQGKGVAVAGYSVLTPLTASKGGPVDEVYSRLARKYGVGESEVGLRWALDQGVVVITTGRNEERLKGYLDKVPAFKLTPKEVEEISEAGRGRRFRGYWKHRIAEGDWR
ncbi:NADP-dependent oxidoreductase domain-containing protein [Podospora conica]|nr:NADP-dependent oxidoreductase domain-containing protein [Schizothecium conicum]